VADLPSAPQLPAPTLLLIGEVLAAEPVKQAGVAPWDPVQQAVEQPAETQFVFENHVLEGSLEWRQ
jgi:hypothetical protein